MSDDTLVRAAEALVAESALDMADEDGQLIEVWTITNDAVTLRASAPRLAVREGMRLAGRIVFDQRPHRVVVEVTEATILSDRRAGLLLTVVEARIDGLQRETERVPMSLRGTLTALICDRVVPGEPLTITIHDLSEGGVGLSVADRRPRTRDLYRLDLRTFDPPRHASSLRPTRRPSQHPDTGMRVRCPIRPNDQRGSPHAPTTRRPHHPTNRYPPRTQTDPTIRHAWPPGPPTTRLADLNHRRIRPRDGRLRPLLKSGIPRWMKLHGAERHTGDFADRCSRLEPGGMGGGRW
jgi:hypothetical protein